MSEIEKLLESVAREACNMAHIYVYPEGGIPVVLEIFIVEHFRLEISLFCAITDSKWP